MYHGTTAIRFLKSLAIARGDAQAARGYAAARDDWHDGQSVVAGLKAAVGGMDLSTIDGGSDVAADFMTALRPLTLVGRLPVRRVPALLPLLTHTSASTVRWVGEGAARPATTLGAFARSSLTLKQVAALAVASNELLADRTLDSENVVLADLLAACAEGLDRAFIDLNNSGDAVTPASVTSTATPIAYSGALDVDLAAAIQQLADAGSTLRSAYWIMSSALAGRLALVRDASGALAYPTVGALGGTIAGLPLITTGAANEADSDSAENIALIDASQISYAEGPPVLRTSQNAMIELDTAPTGDTLVPTAASASFVSMFQCEATALLAQLSCNWVPRREGMVALIADITLEPST